MDSTVTYRKILSDALLERQSRRKSYSLRALARDLDVKPAHLYDVFSKRKGLSLSMAEKIGRKLNLGEDAQSLFCDLVQSEHARSLAQRALAKKRVGQRFGRVELRELKRKEFHLVSKWFYPALLQLLVARKNNVGIEEFSRALSLPASEVEIALDHLIIYGWVKKIGTRYSTSDEYVMAESSTPTDVIRHFHKQLSSLMADRIDSIPMDSRNTLSGIMSFDSSRMGEVREFFANVQTDFLRKFQSKGQDDSVFSLSQLFFRLDQEIVVHY